MPGRPPPWTLPLFLLLLGLALASLSHAELPQRMHLEENSRQLRRRNALAAIGGRLGSKAPPPTAPSGGGIVHKGGTAPPAPDFAPGTGSSPQVPAAAPGSPTAKAPDGATKAVERKAAHTKAAAETKAVNPTVDANKDAKSAAVKNAKAARTKYAKGVAKTPAAGKKPSTNPPPPKDIGSDIAAAERQIEATEGDDDLEKDITDLRSQVTKIEDSLDRIEILEDIDEDEEKMDSIIKAAEGGTANADDGEGDLGDAGETEQDDAGEPAEASGPTLGSDDDDDDDDDDI